MTKPFYYLEAVQENGHLLIRKYGRNGRWDEIPQFKPYCYVEAKPDEMTMRCAKRGTPLKKIEYRMPEDVTDIRNDQRTWEADISFERRYMMDLDLKISDIPKCYMDIETDDTDGASNPDIHQIISIAMIFDDGREVFLSRREYTEVDMLEKFTSLMYNIGMIITWNGGEDIWETRSFDMPYLAKRFGSQFEFDKKLRHCTFVDLYRDYKHEKMRVGMGIAGGYSLENVSQHELGRGKIKHDKRIGDMTDDELKEYNMMDVRLVKEIDEKLQLTDLRISIAQMCNLRMTDWRHNKKRREMTPVRQLDQLFLKECHRNHMAWVTPAFVRDEGESITGALVLEPEVGVHKGVQNMDVKSMYPSIIINEQLSPDKDRIIMPNLLTSILTERRRLKKLWQETGDNKYYLHQYAYKVIANTTYGAMANAGFRGYDKEIAQYITNKGKAILERVRELAEGMNYKVIYGDTDSIFAVIPRDKAEKLIQYINRRMAPYELELGEYYDGILFTGDETGGKKKRYAGLTDGRIVMKGLEGVKSDYCQLGRDIQYLILGKLLAGVSIDECKRCLFNLRAQMREGKYDHLLLLTKGVKALDEYVRVDKRGNKKRLLPHVRALEKAYDQGARNLFEINYFFTVGDDVEPYVEGKKYKIDYDRYYESQVMGVVRHLFTSLAVQNGGKKNTSLRKRKASEESASLRTYM